MKRIGTLRIVCALLASVIVGTNGFAQASRSVSQLEANLRKHVEYLASPQLEGRRTGEPGATAAAGYVVNQFSQFKLKPGFKAANARPSFLQPFPFVAGVTVAEGTFLNVIPANPENVSRLEHGINYMPYANSMGGEIPSSSLVFAGYGITTGDKQYDDYAGLDVRNKVVMIFDGVPAGGTPMQFAGFNLHAKANIAKEKGARAVIVIARMDEFKADPLSRLNYEPTLGETAIPVVALDRAIAADVFGVQGSAAVSEIEKWIAMKTNAPPAISIMLANPPKATSSMKIVLEKRTVDAYNVIGIVEGRDPVLKNEAIVIGAHYDHLGRGGRSSLLPNSNDIHHGADDNASGTAAIIELARQFATEKKNKRTLIFMAFSAEEDGLLGSKHYVNNPVWPLDKTVAMINLDMVGRFVDSLNVGGIGTASEWRPLVNRMISYGMAKDRIADAMGEAQDAVAKRGSPNESAITSAGPNPYLVLNEDGFGPSDHSSFYGKQIPVLFFFTGTHADYHKPSDTAEKINYAGLTKIADLVAAIVRSVDANPTRPTYKVAQTAPTGGRMTFNVSLGTIPAYGDGNDGLTIDGARESSPAAKAGLKAGDKIIKLAGKDVRNISDYMFALGTMKAGEEYEVTVVRGSETLTMKIVPAPAQPR
jgi:aminopeptidase YwaD